LWWDRSGRSVYVADERFEIGKRRKKRSERVTRRGYY